MVSTADCWCGRPPHDDLIDGCAGDRFLASMFGPPDLNTMLRSMITMYGDLLAAAVHGDQDVMAVIRANPLPEPTIELDRAMLRMAGMDVSDDDVRAFRERYFPTGLSCDA